MGVIDSEQLCIVHVLAVAAFCLINNVYIIPHFSLVSFLALSSRTEVSMSPTTITGGELSQPRHISFYSNIRLADEADESGV